VIIWGKIQNALGGFNLGREPFIETTGCDQNLEMMWRGLIRENCVKSNYGSSPDRDEDAKGI